MVVLAVANEQGTGGGGVVEDFAVEVEIVFGDGGFLGRDGGGGFGFAVGVGIFGAGWALGLLGVEGLDCTEKGHCT
jgi:hypothetical protein